MQRDRDSPQPAAEDVMDAELDRVWMGDSKPHVAGYFRARIFPKPGATERLELHYRQPMRKRTVPITDSRFKVSTPVPDMLYGYDEEAAYPELRRQLIDMGNEMDADNSHYSLIYPFFVVEFVGDGDGLWAATNRCLGGSAACVNILEKLKRRLRRCGRNAAQVNSTAFSVVRNGSEVRLFVSWKHERDYYMATAKAFVIGDAEHWIELRKYVRNIIDWGETTRLEQIRNALNALIEDSRE